MTRLFLLALALSPLPMPAASAWPPGKLCAVSLTYDDGLDSQILNASVDLMQYGLRGTFFPTGSSPAVAANATPWKLLVSRGNEIGSHTMVHPCPPGMGDWQKGNTLDLYDDARMAKELDDSVAFIKGLGQRTARSFAFPCGASWIGTGTARHSYKPLVEKRFRFVRGVGNKLADPATVDLMDTPGWNGQGMKGKDWASLIERAKTEGGWLIVMFHGVGGDYLSCDETAHQQLLEYLHKNQETVWTAPFGQIAAAVEGYQKSLKAKP